ncbi:MAG: hypothetical protein AAGG07_00410 [Planctomycetota bacterium]
MLKATACMAMFLISSLLVGCSDFEVIDRGDGSKARVLKKIDSVWPVYAKEFEAQAKAAIATQGDLAKLDLEGSLKNKVVRLYQEMDQLNGQVRTFVTASYTTYQDAILELDLATRERARERWDRRIASLSAQATKLREVSIRIREATTATRSEADVEDAVEQSLAEIRQISDSLGSGE